MNDDSSPVAGPGDDSPPQQPVRTQWHRLLGAMLEMLLTPVGITVQTEVQVISDPPKADVLLLRRKGARWTPSQLRLLCDGLRSSQASQQLLEFKYSESLNGLCLQQAVGYGYFYRQSQQVDERAIQISVISARTPRTAVLKQYGYVETETPGVYRSSYPLLDQVQVIVLNQLRPDEHNAFMQCFASQRRVRESAFTRLQNLDWDELGDSLWEFVIGLHERINVQGDNMTEVIASEGLTPEKIMALGKKVRQSLLATLTPEERLAGLAPRERLEGLAPRERLEGLAPAELSELVKEIEAYLQEQAAKSAPPGE